MRHTATVLLLLALALPASAQFDTEWSANPSYNSASTVRGLAFVPNFADGSGNTNDRLVVVDRGDGQVLRVHDPNTGSLLSSPAFPASVDGGAFAASFRVNDADATTDGMLIACNLGSGSVPFKCYMFADETLSSATELFSFTPSADPFRLGDKINVVGSSSDYSVWVADASTPRVFRFSSDDLSAPTEIALTVGGTPVATNGNAPSVSPRREDGSTGFFVNGNGTSIREYTAAGMFVSEYSTGASSGSNSLEYFEDDDKQNLAVFEYNTSAEPTGYNRGAIVSFDTGLSDASVYGTTSSLGAATSSGGNGDVSIRDNGDLTYTVFVLGSNNGIGAFTTNMAHLPVELTAFSGMADGNRASLRWATASETGNDGFEVQMLTGSAFAPVGWVDGHGTTLEARSYAFTTAELAPGTYTFRLRQLDLDGAESLTGTVEVTVTGAAALSVAPNPSRERAAVTLSVPSAQHVEVSAYDALGRRVATLFSGSADGSVPMTLSGAAPGLYVIVAEGETFRATTTATVLR